MGSSAYVLDHPRWHFTGEFYWGDNGEALTAKHLAQNTYMMVTE